MSYVKGFVARQTHVGIPSGLVEEEHGREAFAGPVSHLYRSQPPTAWVEVDGPLRPVSFDLNQLAPPDAEDPEGWRSPVLENEDLRVSISRLAAPMPFAYRNGDADEVVYVHQGAGVLQTDYGPLDFAEQQYLVPVVPHICRVISRRLRIKISLRRRGTPEGIVLRVR